MPDDAYYFIVILVAVILLAGLFVCLLRCNEEDDRAAQPAESAEQRVDDQPAPQPVLSRSAEQRLARALAVWAEAALAARAEVLSTGQVAPAPAPVPLPYFPYAAQTQSDKPSVTVDCAICLEPLRPGQLCSEVPLCRHVFHRDCLGEWARSNCSCPLCRAKIVPGSEEVAIADDMV